MAQKYYSQHKSSPITEEEIKEIIRSMVKEIGVQGPQDMGKVMKSVMAKVKGQADGRLVSELVKKAIANKL